MKEEVLPDRKVVLLNFLLGEDLLECFLCFASNRPQNH